MNPFRSVGARLSLAFAVVLAVALGVAYVIVVPSLERRLVDAKLSQLERSTDSLVERVLPLRVPQLFVQDAAEVASARVVLYQAFDDPLALSVFADSREDTSADVAEDPVALRAWNTRTRQRGTVTRGGQRFAEVAEPVTGRGPVLLLSASLEDSLATVRLTERRLLAAGLLALAVALAGGYGAASLFARRIRRLERAADRIAGGRFDEPIVDAGGDELGELASAFERMRTRLAQLDHARREFVANASHELRTPLFSLGGFLELLADEEVDEATRREFLDSMRDQVARLTRLATDLLDLSRLDAGRLRVAHGPVDLSAAARALADEFRAVAQAAEHRVDVHVDGPALALGDDERILQIGRTLLENAVRHTPAGTTVHVAAGVENGSAFLAVEDDGPGIPPEHAPNVFERFYRIDGALASGSGLGLAIARELAELMGGRVELDSERGRTVFRIVLPAAGRAQQAEARPPVASPR